MHAAVLLFLAACARPPVSEAEQGARPASTPRPAPAPTPGSDAVATTAAAEGTAPLALQVPNGVFREAEVQCADGSVHPASLQEAGARTVVMVTGLPLGESCVIFWKGSFMSRLAPVTAGQRWACKFRRAEPLCKRLGGPEGPTRPTPDDWVWDKVDNQPVTKAEAKAFDEQQAGEPSPQ